MKYLVVFLLISLAASAYGDMSCEELEKMGEQGVRRMFIFEEGAKIPQNEAELEARCNEGKKLYKTLLEYKKCLKPFPQQIFQSTSQSIGKLLKKNCGDAEGKKMALRIIKCTNEEQIKKMQTCAVGSLDAVQQLAESSDTRGVLLPKMCCLSHVTAECVREKLGDIKCADPDVNIKEHFNEVLATVSKDAMEIACEEYKTMASCQAKIPNEMTKLKQIVNTSNGSFGQRSLIKPLLQVAEKVAN